ncbi:MAG: MFS transporter [Deltaproteobacteria bacterium]
MKSKQVIGLLGLSGFVVMADNWVVSPILPAISEHLNVDIARAGLLIAAYMIPFGIFQIVFGPLSDRYGKKQVITFSMILFTLATGLCALGMGLTDLAIYRALTGIFAASVMPVSLALIGDIFPIQERQGAIGTFMGISFLGQGLSMVKFVAPYVKLLADSKSLFTYLLVVFEGVFIIGSFSYIGAYISTLHHLNYFHIGLIMTAFGLATVLGGRMSGKLVLRMGPRRLLSLGLICDTLADLALAYLGQRLGAMIGAVALLGFGFIFTHSTLLTRATEFAQKARGAAMSLVAFCFMGGGGLGTAIGGRIIGIYGLERLFWVYGMALLITWLLSYGFIRDHVVEENEVLEQVVS